MMGLQVDRHFQRHTWLMVFLGSIVISMHRSADSAEKPAESLKFATQKVIVFKDGYCLVIKKATGVTDKNRELFTDSVPDAAVLGSFWAVSEEGPLVSMVAGWTTAETSSETALPCQQVIEVLAANKGSAAKIELQDKTVLAGVIREVLVAPGTSAIGPEVDILLSSVQLPAAAERTISTIRGSHFILRTDDEDTMLSVDQVRSLSIPNMKSTLTRTLKTNRRTKRLTFRFSEPSAKRSLTLMYFRPGLRWIPAYRLDLREAEGKKLAKMHLQAELLNECEDLHDVPIDIVVGVPNFRFRDVPSPLVLESTLRQTLASAAPALMTQNSLSNGMFNQSFSAANAGAAAGSGAIQLPGDLTAAGVQDLFVYNLPPMNIEQGARAALPVLTAEVPYRDLHTWEVRVSRRDIESAPSGAAVASPLQLSKNEVWRQIVLSNTTRVPWTTGAALIMSQQQPLGQDMLTYTPPKNEVRVPVTIAVDVRGFFEESETDRQLKALSWDGFEYAKISKEGRLRVINNKPSPIEIEISLRAGGKVTTATQNGKIELHPFESSDWTDYRGHPAVNNHSRIVWRTTLAAGAPFEAKIQYHYFARH